MKYTREDAAINRYVTMGPDEYFGYDRNDYYYNNDDYNYDDDYSPSDYNSYKKEINELSKTSFNEDEIIWY